MKNLFALLFFVGLMSCKEEAAIIPPPPPPGDRVVLMEEFSGGKCTPCATASQRIGEFSTQYEGKFIAVTIHTNAGGQADPYPGAKFDFRTEDGDELQQYLGGADPIPSGVINRKIFEGEYSLQHIQSKWSGIVQQAIVEKPMLNLSLITTFDPTTRALNAEVTIVPLNEITGDLRLVSMVVENHLIDKQAFPNTDGVDPDFEHNHILRDIISPVYGDPIDDLFRVQVPIVKNISYVIPKDDQDWWKPENMEIVVFVVNNQADSNEVLQAAIAHVIE